MNGLSPLIYGQLSRFARDFPTLMVALAGERDRVEGVAQRGLERDPALRRDLADFLRAGEGMLEATARYLDAHPQSLPAPAAAKREMPFGTVQRRAETISPSSFSDADGTVEVIFTTGAGVVRYDWDGAYVETLDVTSAAVRLDRLNAGAPFLNTHQSGDISRVLGSVVPGSARIQGGLGLARIKLSENPALAGFVQDIRAGVIRNVSVGYLPLKVLVSEETATRPRTMRVTEWQPFEISAVPVPADAGAQIRAL